MRSYQGHTVLTPIFFLLSTSFVYTFPYLFSSLPTVDTDTDMTTDANMDADMDEMYSRRGVRFPI